MEYVVAVIIAMSLIVFFFLFGVIDKLLREINKGDSEIDLNLMKILKIHIKINLISHKKNDK